VSLRRPQQCSSGNGPGHFANQGAQAFSQDQSGVDKAEPVAYTPSYQDCRGFPAESRELIMLSRRVFPFTLSSLAVMALIFVESGLALAQEGTTARDAEGPSHVYDKVPAVPPAPEYRPPAPKPPEPPKPQPPVVTAKPKVTWLSPAPYQTWYDGDTMTLKWETAGPVAAVRIQYHGEKIKLGGKSRGEFDGVLNEGKIWGNTRSTTWKVPWLDGTAIYLRIVAFDGDGKQLAEAERKVALLPREFKKLPKTCIAVSKRLQRLYYFVDGEIKRAHIVSTAAAGHYTPTMKPGSYDARYGHMGKVFNKAENPMSQQFQVKMPWWLAITASGSHGLHATSPNLYYRLGSPASHGCVRQHYADAHALYQAVSVGTPVYIF
jgi:hypothetical protein